MAQTGTASESNIALPERLVAALPERVAEALRALCHAATEEELPLYLVGGVVRDYLLLDPPVELSEGGTDIDLAVDGDPSSLHVVLARFGAVPPTVHDRFGTASVRLADELGGRIDLARTRAERYSAPGALPLVEPAPILADLRRRDFTVNAAAYVLSGADAGLLLDPHGAAEDARSQTIRTLHSRSFVDDPTRLIRAARYAARLEGRLSRETASEVRQQRHYLAVLTPGRFGDAWRLLLSERDRAGALGQAQRMRLPQGRWPDWSVAPRVVRVVQSPEHFWASVGLTEPSRAVLNELRVRIALQRGEQAALNDGARLRALRRQLGRLRRPAAVARLLETMDAAALDAAASLWSGVSQGAVLDYQQRRATIRPPIRASRLIELGVPRGPAVGGVVAVADGGGLGSGAGSGGSRRCRANRATGSIKARLSAATCAGARQASTRAAPMTTDSSDSAPCVVCGDPAVPDGRSDCYICGEYFHLRLTTTAEGPDCGDVWIDDEVMALQFACRRCLDERMNPQAADSNHEPEEVPQTETRRVRRAAPGASARDLARRRRR